MDLRNFLFLQRGEGCSRATSRSGVPRLEKSIEDHWLHARLENEVLPQKTPDPGL